MDNENSHFIIFGVAGSGKTFIGNMLAKRLNIEFIEGDDFHPECNVEKMKSGHPLTDADRMPWLQILKEQIDKRINQHQGFVMSCSALKVEYRAVLRNAGEITFLFLNVPENVIAIRLLNRKNHFMPASLLHSQITTLEMPQKNEKDILTIDASLGPAEVMFNILREIADYANLKSF